MNAENDSRLQRRDFLRSMGRYSLLGGLGLLAGGLAFEDKIAAASECGGEDCRACHLKEKCDRDRSVDSEEYVWQIDPDKCVQCGRCATECVLNESAVKCVHSHSMCGYCELCFGYFQPGANALSEAAENQICPTGAIRRGFIEDPFFEYTIDEPLCIGCGKCVAGCNTFGNGSLYLQVMHDRCVNCNDCAIARACAGDAFVRVPAGKPYLLKHEMQ